nr:hypothetical protein [Tanacetum cinerariifolium]
MVNTSNKYDLLSNEYNVVFEECKGMGKEAGRIKKHEDLNVGDYGEVYEVHNETIRFMAMVRVEYEWKPLRCDSCKIFGHTCDQCPKKVVVSTHNVEMEANGFQYRPKLTKLRLNLLLRLSGYYWFVAKNMVNTSNKYDLLSNEYNAVFEEGKGTGKEAGRIKKHEDLNVGDYGKVYEVHDETVRFIACTSSKVNELTKSGNGEGNTTCMKNGRRLMMMTRKMMITLIIVA